MLALCSTCAGAMLAKLVSIFHIFHEGPGALNLYEGQGTHRKEVDMCKEIHMNICI